MKTVFIAVAASAAILLMGGTGRTPSAVNGTMPSCVAVRTESRYVPYGYNHVVLLTNGCGGDVRCTVTTDVNPSPIVVTVAVGTTAEVLTFMCSPQPAFVASVSCELPIATETRAVTMSP